MAIGRYRDAPTDMDEVEREVAAAQYPEGGLVAGMGTGILLAIVTVEALLAVAPIVGALAGYGLGRRVHAYAIRRRTRNQDDGRDGEGERKTDSENGDDGRTAPDGGCTPGHADGEGEDRHAGDRVVRARRSLNRD